MHTVLTGGSFLWGEDLELLEGAWVEIRDGTIVACGQGDPPRRGRAVDVRHRLLIPGLINGHTHVDDGVLKEVGFGIDGWEAVMPPGFGLRHRRLSQTDPELIRQGMQDAMRLMLQTGTVAFVDYRMGGREGVLEVQELAASVPIRVLAMGRHATQINYTEDEYAKNEQGLPPGYGEEIEEICEVASGFSVVTANDTTDVGLAETRAIVRKTDGLLTVHAAEDDRYREISVRRTGRSDVERIVEHLKPDFIVHMTNAADAEFQLVADANIPVVVCHRMEAVMGYGIPPIEKMVSLGIRVALGTDNVMLTNPDLIREMEFVSRVTRALTRDAGIVSPTEMLKMTTVNPAKMFGLDQDLGWLDIGKEATMVAIDTSSTNLRGSEDIVASLVNRADRSDIAAVMVKGNVVHGDLAAA